MEKAVPSNSLSSTMGDAVTTTLLLRHWEKYGLSDRVCYHFDLTEALDVLSKDKESSTERKFDRISTNACGVVTLLECVPRTPWHRLTLRQKRALWSKIRDFNLTANNVHNDKRVLCHEPQQLPLRLNPASRVFFTYEVTRIAFCLDASPTLTSTFGGRPEDETCCPMDRLAGMARTFFSALVKPIAAPSIPNKGLWCPEISVSVVAVYPRGTGMPQSTLLVRDFKLHDAESAELLANHIEEWALTEVETEISRRLNSRRSTMASTLFCGYDAWTISLFSSSLRDIVDVGDATLNNLSSQARPCIVVATDGRSISCDSVMDILSDADRADVPVIVLDLSSPLSHSTDNLDPQVLSSGTGELTTINSTECTESSFMNYDPGGPATFPLHLSDDTEALLGICKATGGCFFDAQLLADAARTIAGQTDPDSVFNSDHFFSFKRRSLKPNAVQYYILFSLSPLSPTLHSSWGQLGPPRYLRHKLPSSTGKPDPPTAKDSLLEKARYLSGKYDSGSRQSPTVDLRRSEGVSHREPVSRTRFLTYIVNPIRIKGILLMRVKEGYRAKQYGQSTQDPDKVFIQFTLPLELGTYVHYELSYKALTNQSHMVGFANVKIELSGESGFIQSVKNDFLRQSQSTRPVTMAQQISAKLCKVLRWIRKEDVLQSHLCPLKWSDQLSGPETPFVRRLRTLTPLQRRRHFRYYKFEVICTGRMPYVRDDEFLSEFVDFDTGEQELIDTISAWSTQTIKEGKLYVKKTESSDNCLAAYCVVELSRSSMASRIYTIAVESFGVSGATDRLDDLSSLKRTLLGLKNVVVMAKQKGQHVVRVTDHISEQILFLKQHLLESHYNHASWDLVKDPEVLPLLLKRRTEIGEFKLLEYSDGYALLGKVVPSKEGETLNDASPGMFIQYQIAILADRIVIEIHMESESGRFFPFRPIDERTTEQLSQFHKIVKNLRRRDQECGRALRSRTRLLWVFEKTADSSNSQGEESHLSCVHRLLPYSSRVSRKLRFFHSGTGVANSILQNLTEDMLLSESFGVRVARLPINVDEEIRDVGKGLWFLIRFDRHTISMAHLSVLDQTEGDADEDSFLTFRELTFFTIGISDLYSARDDVTDDDSADDHISEYMCVSEFADLVDILHKENYASAAYLSLKSDSQEVGSFHQSDFAEVLSVCEFVEVARVLVAGAPLSADGGQSKLQQLIGTLLHPVGGDSSCTFFCGIDRDAIMFQMDGDENDSLSTFEDPAEIPLELTEEDDDSDQFSNLGENNVGVTDQISQAGDETVEKLDLSTVGDARTHDEAARNLDIDPLAFPLLSESVCKLIINPPLFVQFRVDGKVVSMKDLSFISTSSSVAAHVSVFKQKYRMPGHPTQLPRSHGTVAVALSDLLNAYVAEQTLERLRHFGPSLTVSDLRLVKTCLRRAHDVIKSKIEVFFYVAKTESMVPASAPAGGEAQIDEGFELLMKELQNNGSVALKSFHTDTFVAVDSDGFNSALDFWCLINIKRRRGILTIEVHHPAGAERATEVTAHMHNIISLCYHRVNQLLLLRGLHSSRIASDLLIPIETQLLDDHEASVVPDSHQIFKPGLFSCPIVFSTTLDLFHRCATSPSQVARKLEETVLDSFAVSNRRGIFVYKDETGAIFYMTLEAVGGGGVEPDGRVKLVVNGVQDPGPSVTKQLRQLLQKRLLLISLDMLSSVLIKNPQFHWKKADLNFIRDFKNEWKDLEADQHGATDEKERMYELPPGFRDTGTFLLMFRQNLCGSTFFHRLHDAMIEGDARSTSLMSCDDTDGLVGSAEVGFNPRDFTFYYNNAPTKLDPNFQGVSTLTEQGSEYGRQAGSGIAILQVSVAHSDGTPFESLRVGDPVGVSERMLDVPADTMQVHRRVIMPDVLEAGKTFVKIRITDTALNSEILHKWIHLTLNQVLSACLAEKHIYRMQRRLFRDMPSDLIHKGPGFSADYVRKSAIDSLCPGLPALTSMFNFMHSLPHPALTKIEAAGMIRSSSIATVTIELLEKIIMTTILAETRKLGSVVDPSEDLRVIRLSRSGQPRLVKLEWDLNKREAIVRVVSNNGKQGEIIRDSPVDCPDYICFYCYPQYADKKRSLKKLFPKLFKEIMIADGSTEKSAAFSSLEMLKEKNPTLFFRSFGFVFSVKRNRRLLLAYNWSPNLCKTVTTRLVEKDKSLVNFAARSMDTLQFRTLKILAPPTSGMNSTVSTESNIPSNDPRERRSVIEAKKSTDTDNAAPEDPLSRSGRKLRANRPTVIRRPKLIGKSVEGAAQQAVAASRARASTTRYRGSGTAGSGQPSKGKHDDGNKRSPAGTSENDSGRPSLAANRKSSNTPGDEALTRVINSFDSIMKAKPSLSISQSEGVRNLTGIWWPTNVQKGISRSVADFILAKSSLTWIDVCELLPFPARLVSLVPLSLARTIAMWTPGLELLPSSSSGQATSSKSDSLSVLLMGEIKNVRSCKCFAVVKIGRSHLNVNGKAKGVLRSEGWVLTLPRHPTKKGVRKRRAMVNSTLSEKDSAGMDKLATDLNAVLVLESLQFDFVGSVVERVMKSVDKSLKYDEVMPLVQSMMKRYPLQRQRCMRRLNYRVFEATIVLASFRNRLIDLFDSQILFGWLFSNCGSRDLIQCGDGLCFKREIIVRGTHSICFLTSKNKDPTKLELVILCRTQGRDLHEFMFRQGSNVAISTLDNITVEAAGLAYEELRFVAECLRRNSLWGKVSKTPLSGAGRPSQIEIDELLSLVKTKPLLHGLSEDSIDAQHVKQVLDCEMDWNEICTAMNKDQFFSPSSVLSYSDNSSVYLFFLKTEDIFLLIRVSKNGRRLLLDFVEKEDGVTGQKKQNEVLQKIVNYLLHYIWFTI